MLDTLLSERGGRCNVDVSKSATVVKLGGGGCKVVKGWAWELVVVN